jgi:hypothetical protein
MSYGTKQKLTDMKRTLIKNVIGSGLYNKTIDDLKTSGKTVLQFRCNISTEVDVEDIIYRVLSSDADVLVLDELEIIHSDTLSALEEHMDTINDLVEVIGFYTVWNEKEEIPQNLKVLFKVPKPEPTSFTKRDLYEAFSNYAPLLNIPARELDEEFETWFRNKFHIIYK